MCTDHEHKLLEKLSEIEKKLSRREPQYQAVPISDYLSFLIDYKERRFLFVWSPVALTLSSGDLGTFSLPAEVWYPLAFRPNTPITTSGQATPVILQLLATDDDIDALTIIGAGSTVAATQSGAWSMAQSGAWSMAQSGIWTMQPGNTPNTSAWLFAQSNNNISVPTGAANTIIKASAGALATIFITTTGSGVGNVQIFDNPATNAGTVLAAFPANATAGQSFPVYGWAKTGMIAQNVASGPVFTVFFA